MNEDQEFLKEIISRQIVGQRLVESFHDWKCVHDVELQEFCTFCAKLLSFRDQIEGK